MPQKLKVMIVEDNEDERLFMIEGFTSEGHYDVIAAVRNGDEMLETLNKRSAGIPQLVISDLNMPGKNGYDVIADVKSNDEFSHIPVVILTTAPYVPFAEKCKKLGACAYFTKPDTFLEYRDFAGKIYGQLVNDCLKN